MGNFSLHQLWNSVSQLRCFHAFHHGFGLSILDTVGSFQQINLLVPLGQLLLQQVNHLLLLFILGLQDVIDLLGVGFSLDVGVWNQVSGVDLVQLVRVRLNGTLQFH